MQRVVPVITFARSLGGMQGSVRRHLARDAVLGYEPEVASIFEPPAPGCDALSPRNY